MAAALPQIAGSSRRATISWLLGKGASGRSVRLSAEAVTFSFVGEFGGASVELRASGQGDKFHAITDAKSAPGSEFVVLPPSFLAPRVIGGTDKTMIACRLTARLRG